VGLEKQILKPFFIKCKLKADSAKLGENSTAGIKKQSLSATG